jgi:hypothetical protein
MAIQTITYDDKVALNENPGVAEINKVTDDNMNEIKSVVNNNASETSTNTTKITNLQAYSTSETKIGTWIDGKPLYRKVIDTGALPNATTKTVSSGISNLKKIVFIHGIGHNTTSDTYIPIPYPSSTANQTLMVYFTNGSVNLLAQTNYAQYDESYIVLEYTKTTD